MKLRDLLNLGKTQAKTGHAAAKAPARTAAKGLRHALRGPRSTPEQDTLNAGERAADRAILAALDAKDEPPRKR